MNDRNGQFLYLIGWNFWVLSSETTSWNDLLIATNDVCEVLYKNVYFIYIQQKHGREGLLFFFLIGWKP
jgi:hypothetical protein